MPQVIAQAKIEKSLRDEVTVILDELGLDVPTAIRMYLKAIVREKGIPVALRLSSVEASAEPAAAVPAPEALEEAVEAAPEAVPEKPRRGRKPAAGKGEEGSAETADAADFIDLICRVPAGSVTRWSDMEAYLSAVRGHKVVAPANAEWPRTNAEGLAIPYWRVITERGSIREDAVCPKDLRREMLTAEGHEMVPAGHGIFSGEKVGDYKAKLVSFDD